MSNTSPLVKPSPGFGLGLRTPHYTELLAAVQPTVIGQAQKKPVDWLEIITDNFLVEGGKPLVMLDQFASHYPLAMHGVAMSLGSSQGLDIGYLKRVKQLAQRIEPIWISDHLCWTGNVAATLHDLNPLPYTQEAANTVIRNLKQAQDVLGRRLVVENVSSYVTFQYSAREEWEFLSYVLQESDSLLLLDVNNVYVSSRNHGFNALDYIHGLPKHRVQQIHLAGHSDNGTHIIDTHDHPVSQGVWDLYAQVCALLGPMATMIERDDNIPPLSELLAELSIARQTSNNALKPAQALTGTKNLATAPATIAHVNVTAPSLLSLQGDWVRYILSSDRDAGLPEHIASPTSSTTDTAKQRLGIYHHAYRARLSEVLADSFEKTALYMGQGLFHELATAFAVAHPPQVNSLNRYGNALPDWLATQYPDNPELHQLAQLEWDLRVAFDGQNSHALNADITARDTTQSWLSLKSPLVLGTVLRPLSHNAVQIWRAIDDDTEVPEAIALPTRQWLVVWRKGLQPQFKTLGAQEHAFLTQLQNGDSIVEAIANNQATDLSHEQLGLWLAQWLEEGLLRSL